MATGMYLSDILYPSSSEYDTVQVANPVNPADKVAVCSDQLMSVDMLHRMLELDAAKRITPRQMLER
ncbi:hypothetical protein ABVT39_027051 [Epinephelus coioides]